MEGSLISGMRTAAVTAIAVRHLAKPSFSHVSCVGCGPIARMQLCTLLEQFPFIEAINLFDLRTAAAENLSEHLQVCFPEVKCTVASTAELAIREGDIVIPCTVTDKPYIHYEWLKTGAFVSNVSVMDVHKEVFLKADKVIVDDWEQANREKKIINQLVLEGRFSRENLHAELSEIITGQQPGREANEEIIILNPMGMAIEDIACAQSIYQFALNRGIGTWLNLY
jgi:ornithine cyclodeaminase